MSLLPFLAACDNAGDKDETDGGGASADLDGDGVSEADGDCDDRNKRPFRRHGLDGGRHRPGLRRPGRPGCRRRRLRGCYRGGDDCDDTDAAVSPKPPRSGTTASTRTVTVLRLRRRWRWGRWCRARWGRLRRCERHHLPGMKRTTPMTWIRTAMAAPRLRRPLFHDLTR